MTKRTLIFLSMLMAMVVFAAACGTTTNETSTGGLADTDTAQVAEAEADDSSGETDTPTTAAATETPGTDTDPDGDSSNSAGSSNSAEGTNSGEGRLGALLFADTLASPDAPTSVRFEGVYSLTGAPGSETPGTFALRINGAIDTEADALRTTVDFSELAAMMASAEEEIETGEFSFEAFFEEPMEMIVIGERGWVRWGLFAMFLGENVWVEMEADEVDATTEDFGSFGAAGDPTELLEQFADADATIEMIGVETVNGVETDHWRALVDLDQVAAEASPEERAELEEQFGDLSQEPFPIDVWIGVENGLVYRYRFEVSPEALAAGDDDMELIGASLQFDFFDYDEDVNITPPPTDQVRSGEELFGNFGN